MRVFKFRAWDGEKYNYGGFVIYPNGGMEYPEGGWDLSGYKDGDLIEQYTGLKDKNGTEIYEGDIINGINDRYYRVIFISGSFDINDPMCCETCKNGRGSHGSLNEYLATISRPIEVIGNIHKNPELIDHA